MSFSLSASENFCLRSNDEKQFGKQLCQMPILNVSLAWVHFPSHQRLPSLPSGIIKHIDFETFHITSLLQALKIEWVSSNPLALLVIYLPWQYWCSQWSECLEYFFLERFSSKLNIFISLEALPIVIIPSLGWKFNHLKHRRFMSYNSW